MEQEGNNFQKKKMELEEIKEIKVIKIEDQEK